MENHNKTDKWSKRFVLSASIVLLATGLAKIFSINGSQGILDLPDPIFGIQFRHLMLFMGLLETITAAICLGTLKLKGKANIGLIAWIASGFMIYRLGLLFVGWTQPCPCLGSYYDTIHLSPAVADVVAKGCLIYLLTGSYLFLWLNRVKQLKK